MAKIRFIELGPGLYRVSGVPRSALTGRYQPPPPPPKPPRTTVQVQDAGEPWKTLGQTVLVIVIIFVIVGIGFVLGGGNL